MTGTLMMIEVAGACGLAAVSAVAGATAYVKRCREENRTRKLRLLAGLEQADTLHAFAVDGLTAWVLTSVVRQNRRLSASSLEAVRHSGHRGEGAAGAGGEVEGSSVAGRARARLRTQLEQAGLPEVQPAACAQAAMRLAAMAAAPGALIGLALSPAAAAFLGVAAAIAGASAPFAAVRSERRGRAEALARELPEMLEVCALGLRSGLTFDRSFRLYPMYVSTTFASECANVCKQIDVGLTTRSEAFRSLCSGYDSPLLERTLKGVEQALLRGTSLADELTAAAEESRKQFRAEKERVIARSPIKMMLPIGALILPAMLLLVLGPVILGLLQGL